MCVCLCVCNTASRPTPPPLPPLPLPRSPSICCWAQPCTSFESANSLACTSIPLRIASTASIARRWALNSRYEFELERVCSVGEMQTDSCVFVFACAQQLFLSFNVQLKPLHIHNRPTGNARVEERNMRRFKRALEGSGIRLMRPIRDRYSTVDFRLIADRQVPNHTFAFSFPISDYVMCDTERASASQDCPAQRQSTVFRVQTRAIEIVH
jgi:hypothetical protein